MRESALRAHDLKNQKSLTFENKSIGSRTTQTTQFWNVRLKIARRRRFKKKKNGLFVLILLF